MKKWLNFDMLFVGLMLAIVIFSCFQITHYPTIETFCYYKTTYPTIYLLLFIATLFALPIIELLLNISWLPLHRKLLVISFSLVLMGSMLNFRFTLNCNFIFYVFSIICLIKERKIHRPLTLIVILFIYFLVQFTSIFWIDSQKIDILSIKKYMPFFTFVIAFSMVRFDKNEIMSVAKSFYRFMLLFGILCVANWLIESNALHIPLREWFVSHKTLINGQSSYDQVYNWTYFSYPTFNVTGLIIAFSVGIYLLNNIKRGNFKKLVLLMTYFLFIAIIAMITQSRTGLVVLCIISVIGVGFFLRQNKQVLYIYSFTVIVCSVIFTLTFHSFIGKFLDDPVRKQLINTALYSIKQHPVGGTGVGGMDKIINSSEISTILGYPSPCSELENPHNQFIGDMMQTGIFGLSILLVMMGYLYYSSITKRNWLLFNFLIITTFLMFIEMPLAKDKGIILFVPFTLLFWNYGLRTKQESGKTSQPKSYNTID